MGENRAPFPDPSEMGPRRKEALKVKGKPQKKGKAGARSPLWRGGRRGSSKPIIAARRGGVAAGRIGMSSAYLRPDLHQVQEKDQIAAIKKALDNKELEQLSKNMWIIGRQKRQGGAGAGFITGIMIRREGEYWFARIITDGKGRIPVTIQAERLMDIADGDREGRRRNIVIDVYEDAKRKTRAKDKNYIAESYWWYLWPNEMDINTIDDPDSMLLTILTKKEKISGPRALIINGGTEEERQALANVIKNNFTIAEKKVIAGNLITIKQTPAGVAGLYRKPVMAIAARGGGFEGVGQIEISPRYANEKSDTLIHEAIHALRDQDAKREGPLKAPPRYIGRDADVEEALTEAEAVIRQRPMTKHETRVGYYHYLPEIDKGEKTHEAAVKEDRISGTEPPPEVPWDSKPKKGKVAQKKTVKNFPRMNIRKLKMQGGVEAIDTFFKIQGEEGKVSHVQVYSPGGGTGQARALQAQAKGSGINVSEWRDGKEVVIKGKRPKMKAPCNPCERSPGRRSSGVIGVSIKKGSNFMNYIAGSTTPVLSRRQIPGTRLIGRSGSRRKRGRLLR